jgi:hypothetical protein
MRRIALLIGLLLAAATGAHAQWQIEDSTTTADLRGIDSVGGGIAWASGTNGTVVRTEDGGYEWQPCTIPPGAEHLDFRGIQAFDANTAIVMSSGKGDLSRLYKTTDGCQTWKLVFTNPDKDGFFDSVYFSPEQGSRSEREGFGLLLGDAVNGVLVIFETRDAGYTWYKLSDDILKTHGSDLSAFAASNSCISGFGGATFDLVVGGVAGSYLIRLSYKGQYWLNDSSQLDRSWQKLPLPMTKGVDSAGAFSVGERIEFPKNNHAPDFADLKLHEVIVGGNYMEPSNREGTAAYHSGGDAWLAAEVQPHGYRSSVAYDDATKTWITVGPNGTDISTDDGRNWRAVHPDAALHEAPDADRNWNALSLPFVVGPHGRIGKLDAQALTH